MRVLVLRATTRLALAVSTVACGLDSGGTGDVAAGPGTGSGSSGGMSAGGSTSSSGGSSSAMSGSPDGSAPAAESPGNNSEVASSTTLRMNSFAVRAGQEVFMCQDFANPFQGEQADVKAYELHMTQGSHHMLAFYKVGATDG